MTPEAPADGGLPGLLSLAASIEPLDEAAMATAGARLDRLTKPPGSLGRLEHLAVQLAGIHGAMRALDRPAIAVFAGDHGIGRRGVSPYPQDVTRQMVATYASGRAAINVLAGAASAELVVVDVGVAGDPLDPVASGTGVRLVIDRVRAGPADFSEEPALERREVLAAIDVGRRVVDQLADEGADLIGVGEMGIGNTSASSAIVAVLSGRRVVEVTGPGTGLDPAGVSRKARILEAAIARHGPDPDEAVGVLAAVGGLEIAALVGAILAAGARRVPLVLDGFITSAAALVASRLAPALVPRLIAAHRSPEPGHAIVLDALDLSPILSLDLRLGEGTGAALAIPIVRAASRIPVEMATFEDAGVSNRD